ncbi:MAG: OmpH family outer membrane protein [Prolixibacteraceae bacterium]|jgi:outer membrane protein|nr:OmpH family outer membrane protein [Prolixibacteraceae bacterium]
MKKSSLIVNVVMAVAIVLMYILYFTSGKSGGSASEPGEKQDGNQDRLKIAYVKVDSLIVNYDLAQVLHDGFTQKQEAYTKEYASKRTQFEEQAVAFQEKVQRGGFLTQERAIQERDRLVGEEQQIARLDQELSTKLAQLQSENNKQLLDSLINYLKIYNADKKYDYILNSGEILIGDEASNITKSVLKELNARYAATKIK